MSNIKIAFDMDGVFLPDYHHMPGLTEQEFFMQTLFAKPMIDPWYDYIVITGRVERWRNVTERWFNQVQNPPKAIYMRPNTDERAVEFKARILNSMPDIKTYVESDWEICKYLDKHCLDKLRVLHFSAFTSGRAYDH